MSESDLKAQFDAAVVAGDLATLERIGPMLYPEDGSTSPVAAAPSAPAAAPQALDAQMADLRTRMMTSSAPALQEELNALLQQRYPDATPDPATTRDAWRPDLPPGYSWDGSVVADFEETAPGGPTLMHVVADALRSSRRYDDVDATIATLEARYGEAAAVALAEDATAYLREYGTRRIEAALRERGLLFHPDLIYRAAMFWRQRTQGQ